ncbi:MAG: radical SAM family heme chaperone HemW [Alphaproteobacteria bacterium]|nr:radical SAM family heme chaperone HemW [Alphaproteobacteria bacterium]
MLSIPPCTPLPSLSLYLHWPYCQHICPFCDFNVYRAGHGSQSLGEGEWLDALTLELDYYHHLTPNRPLHSVYFGGGTPSLMAPALVGQLLAAIDRRWGLAQDAEITLEANPTSVESARFADFRSAGINRLSLGLQALTDDGLKTLGRRHDRAQTLQALTVAQRLFAKLSTDLIYGRPDQSLASWRQELGEWQSFGIGHASLYQLTIESATPFGQQAQRGALIMPDEQALGDFYDATNQLMGDAGYQHYEVSSYARDSSQRSRHNLLTWQGNDYLGIGAGAHGRLSLSGGRRLATVNRKQPKAWAQAVQSQGHGQSDGEGGAEWLSRQQQAEEFVMLGLRQIGQRDSAPPANTTTVQDADDFGLLGGVDRARFQASFGLDLLDWLDRGEVEFLRAHGLIQLSPHHLAVPRHAIGRLDAILRQLLLKTATLENWSGMAEERGGQGLPPAKSHNPAG